MNPKNVAVAASAWEFVTHAAGQGNDMAIVRKTKEEIEKMRTAGQLVRKVLTYCHDAAKPGTTTQEIDQGAYEIFTAAGANGLFKGYPGPVPFPSNLCISINEQVVHGIASARVIEDGDLVSVDCGVRLDGWCGDAATTIRVGNVQAAHKKLCDITKHVLNLAIANIKPGRKWSQIARLMQNYAERSGVSVVREYVGHGIGREMHEDPKVPNFVSPDLLNRDIELREGMVLAIEPMCNLGVKQVKTLDDLWTVVTADGQPSAHYEHTVAVTGKGADVLTLGRPD